MNADLIAVNNEYQRLLNLMSESGEFSLDMCEKNSDQIEEIKNLFLNIFKNKSEGSGIYERLNSCSNKTIYNKIE